MTQEENTLLTEQINKTNEIINVLQKDFFREGFEDVLTMKKDLSNVLN